MERQQRDGAPCARSHAGGLFAGASLEAAAYDPGTAATYGLSLDDVSGYHVWTVSGDDVVRAAPAPSGAAIDLKSAFEEPYAVVVENSGGSVAYAVDGSDLVKITWDAETETETRQVLARLTSPGSLHGLALSPDGNALYSATR